jgi:uncharacterized repeat protein (TIGR03803 family)
MTRRLFLFYGLLALSFPALSAAVHAEVPGLTILRRFGTNPDGLYPSSPLIQAANGVLYGATPQGGSHANGTIFSVTPAGQFTTLYSFSALDGQGRNADGSGPGALILGSDGNFYGITTSAGAGGFGTIFQMTPSGALTIVYTCTISCSNLLQGIDGNFYGLSEDATVTANNVFRLTPEGTLTVLRTFQVATGLANSLIQGRDGNLYGITSDGVSSTFFRLTTAGVLMAFGHQQRFDTSLSQSTTDGNFYFLSYTDVGSSSPLQVPDLERINLGGLATIVYHPGKSDISPANNLPQSSDGSFYGAFSDGQNSGGIYRLTADGKLTILHKFSGYPAGGDDMGAVIRGTDGNFYGTTGYGGAANVGTIFSASPEGQVTLLHSFRFGDGLDPMGSLVKGLDGNLYGLTESEGENRIGSIFKIAPGGALTTLHTFVPPANSGTNIEGGYPQTLAAGLDGNLYGINSEGGAFGNGTFFRMTPTGALTVVFSFNDEENPFVTLITGRDGNFYGTGDFDGNGNEVFSLSPAGVIKTVHRFGLGNGHVPIDLVQGADGNLYGANTDGSFFRLTTGGQLTVLDPDFAPIGLTVQALFQARDGNFYGATSVGGAYHHGAVFSLTPAGKRTILYSFTGGADGKNPANLIEGSDGNFYGTTSTASYYGEAVTGNDKIFQLTPSGILNVLWNFTASQGRDVALIQGGDGDIYGTTAAATVSVIYSGSYQPGFFANGTLFKLPLAEVADSPLLTSADSPIAVIGQPFTDHVTVNHPGTNYAASGLPGGLTINAASGVISGTPAQAGAYGVSLSAQTTAGTAQATLSLNVVP